MKLKQPVIWAAMSCLAIAAIAQDGSSEDDSDVIEEVVVKAHPLGQDGLAQPSDVLDADELELKAVDNIGATVGTTPGVHNSSYGVGAGRPVIHGLSRARVRVMADQIDTLDVSVSSEDHAVTVDPIVVERIEILKGSSTLLYGSGAIGGVIDIQTGRIPNEVPQRVEGTIDVRGTDNGNGVNGSFRLNGGQENLAWHIDAFSREAEDYDIPGLAESAYQIAAEEEETHHDEHDDHEHEHEDADHHEEEEEHGEEAHGFLPGSGVESRGGSVGFSVVGERGFAGVSISRLDSEYGIPGHSHAHHDHGHHDEEEHHEEEEEHHEEEEEHHDEEEEMPPVVDLLQTRIDLEAGLADPFGAFENLNFRLGINDYEHAENEAGEVGTVFTNNAWEARAQLTHGLMGSWSGTFGLQFGDREFSVVGEEAATPPVDTSSFGLFWAGERSLGDLGLEAGLRYDRVKHDPHGNSSRGFNTASASIGLIMPLNESWSGTLLADLSSRAPVGEELFSDSPHPGTGVFEVGHPELDHESARNLSATLSGGAEGWSLSGTFYYTLFSDFIYQAATGEEREEFEVYLYSQADATFPGFEVEGRVTVAEWGDRRLELGAFFDTVSPTLDISGNDNVPLIPPDRIGLNLAFTSDRLRANVEYIRASEQDDVAVLELPSDSYADLRARIAWRVRPGDRTVDLFLAGRNLTDDEQRLHTSVVKDLAPQPGRTVEAGMRLRF
ncbi:MAG: TonB-dependent receptor [Gammaproteobacteria bacterium]|nr:TonB-dependent receptor [Gammaproteobacteria bacterium]